MINNVEFEVGDYGATLMQFYKDKERMLSWKFFSYEKKKNLVILENKNQLTLTFQRSTRTIEVDTKTKEKLKKLLDAYEWNYKWKEQDYEGLSVDGVLNALNIGGYSIAYGNTRTLEVAHNRKAEAYIISLYGGLVVFKKRGGFIAYNLFLTNYSDWRGDGKNFASTAHITLEKAVGIIQLALANEGLANVYMSKDFKEYVNTKLLLEQAEKEIFNDVKTEILEGL